MAALIMNMDMNGYNYGSEYEYGVNTLESGDESYEHWTLEEEEEYYRNLEKQPKPSKLSLTLAAIEDIRNKAHEEREKRKVEALVVQKIEIKEYDWNVSKKEVLSIKEIILNEKEEKNWKIINYKKEKKEKPVEVQKQNIKTEMCKSFKKYNCKYRNCRFAHSIEELTVSNCMYGVKCKAVNTDSKRKIYRNDSKKDKVCFKLHPDENLENFYVRTGLKNPEKVTEEEMNVTEDMILKFEDEVLANKTSTANFINQKIRFLPVNETFIYELVTPYNFVNICFNGLGEKRKEKKIKDVVKVDKKEIQKAQQEQKRKDKIEKLQIQIKEMNEKIKKNKNLIDRFSPRVNNEQCQKLCENLKKENEFINKNISVLEKNIDDLNKKHEPKVEEKKVEEKKVEEKKVEEKKVEEKKVEEKKVEEKKVEKSQFNINSKSFIMALGVVSNEPSQKCCEKEDVKSETSIKSIKTEMCRSVGKYKCHIGVNCRFAHNLKELKIINCAFGDRCFDVECISGKYINIQNNKNRICQRQHPTETLENVYNRLNIKNEEENKVNKIKSELCKSYGRYTCNIGKNCKYAHNFIELNVLKCSFGDRCFDVDCVSGRYLNKRNTKNRICQRQHPWETLKNVHDRLLL